MIEQEPKSRRDFLKIFIPRRSERKIESLTSFNGGLNLSRRDFLGLSTGLGAAFALSQAGIRPTSAEEVEKPTGQVDSTPRQADQTEELYTRLEDKDPSRIMTGFAIATVGGPAVTYGTNILAGRILDRFNIEQDSYRATIVQESLQSVAKISATILLASGGIFSYTTPPEESKKFRDEMLNRPLAEFIAGSIMAPIVEELMFRWLPSSLASSLQRYPGEGYQWGVGIPSAVIFALLHGVSPAKENKPASFKWVPVSQFMGGLYYWYLMREKDITHPILAHSYHNTIAFSIQQLFYRAVNNEL